MSEPSKEVWVVTSPTGENSVSWRFPGYLLSHSGYTARRYVLADASYPCTLKSGHSGRCTSKPKRKRRNAK